MLQLVPQCRQICPTSRITAAVLPSGFTEQIEEKHYPIKTFENLQAAITWMEQQQEEFDLRVLSVEEHEEKREN